MPETAFHVVNENAESPLILLGEHAGNAFPSEYGTLGLPQSLLDWDRNIPYDFGSASILRKMAEKMGVTAVLGHYSRILIDLNRLVGSPSLIPPEAHGNPIPGNQEISEEERQKRIDQYYKPFHEALTAQIDRRVALGQSPILFGVHSYTPRVALAFDGVHDEAAIEKTPDIGVLYVDEGPLVARLRATLSKRPEILVAENFPYGLSRTPGSIHHHGINRGFECAIVEISIKRLTKPEDETFWADILSEACNAVHS